jgi:outer membrane protein OmpA-like peptidoglycan-associated protein
MTGVTAVRVVGCLAVLVLAVTGCSGSEGGAGSPSATATPKPSAPAGPGSPSTAGAPAATASAVFDGTTLRAEALPAARSGKTVTVTLDVTVEKLAEGTTSFLPGEMFGDRTKATGRLTADDLRLVDPGDRTVHLAARDADDACICTGPEVLGKQVPAGGTFRVQTTFAAPTTGTGPVDLLVPQFPVLAGLRVIDGSAPAPQPGGTAPALGDVSTAPVLTTISGTEVLKGALRDEEGPDSVRLTLDSTVLFGKDSAALTARADAVLARVAARLERGGPGKLAIVGYTDDLGSAAHGLALSRARAQAVQHALAPALPAAGYPTTVTGKGESDPLVPNRDEASRRRNRRVEITYLAERPPATPSPSSSPTATPSATGVPSASMTDQGRRWTVRVAGARRAGPWLAVDLEITLDAAPGGGTSAVVGDLISTRDADSTRLSANGVRALDPARGQALLAVRDSEAGCLCANNLSNPVRVGQAMTVPVYLAAPDAAATQLTVEVPGFPPVSGVSVG